MSERKQWSDMTKKEKRAGIWFLVLLPVVIVLALSGPVGWIGIVVILSIVGWLGIFDDLSRAAGKKSDEDNEKG